MVSNEQEAQQVVICHIGGLGWPTLLLLTSSAAIYVAALAHLLTEPTLSSWALAGITFCTIGFSGDEVCVLYSRAH